MHQPLAIKAADDDEPHPEQPARIIGVFKRIEGPFVLQLLALRRVLTVRFASRWSYVPDGPRRRARSNQGRGHPRSL